MTSREGSGQPATAPAWWHERIRPARRFVTSTSAPPRTGNAGSAAHRARFSDARPRPPAGAGTGAIWMSTAPPSTTTEALLDAAAPVDHPHLACRQLMSVLVPTKAPYRSIWARWTGRQPAPDAPIWRYRHGARARRSGADDLCSRSGAFRVLPGCARSADLGGVGSASDQTRRWCSSDTAAASRAFRGAVALGRHSP
jgi:hypothetical protein